MKKSSIRNLLRLTALLLILCLLPVLAATEQAADDWVYFLLICNEGMNNEQSNAGNTLMVVGMDPVKGRIRLMMFTWDTFIDYEGYDVPQKLDMPYRNNGPEEAMKVLNQNFGLNITHYLSLNYLNMASLIDDYGGVTVDITRAERNALNGLVGSKRIRLQEEVAGDQLSQTLIDLLAQQYYLSEFGSNVHLNGLQAVGFGWLQYDSVYNCCERDAEVIAALFHSTSEFITDRVILFSDETEAPAGTNVRRAVNLDHLSDEDYAYIRKLIDPIFEKSDCNMEEKEIRSITLSLARIAYQAQREGKNILDFMRYTILPLEATKPYDIIAGTKGHIVDKEANIEAVREFLSSD